MWHAADRSPLQPPAPCAWNFACDAYACRLRALVLDRVLNPRNQRITGCFQRVGGWVARHRLRDIQQPRSGLVRMSCALLLSIVGTVCVMRAASVVR